MYCPKCSQQQVAEAARFCSRCGFPLDAVVELIANDGLPAPRAAAPPEVAPPLRRKGIREGAKVGLAGLVLMPIGYALCFVFHSPIPFVITLTVFLMGLAQMLYFRVFGDVETPVPRRVSFLDAPPARDFALPSVAAAQLPPRVNTAEMAPPSSVAEQTTTLLDKD